MMITMMCIHVAMVVMYIQAMTDSYTYTKTSIFLSSLSSAHDYQHHHSTPCLDTSSHQSTVPDPTPFVDSFRYVGEQGSLGQSSSSSPVSYNPTDQLTITDRYEKKATECYRTPQVSSTSIHQSIHLSIHPPLHSPLQPSIPYLRHGGEYRSPVQSLLWPTTQCRPWSRRPVPRPSGTPRSCCLVYAPPRRRHVAQTPPDPRSLSGSSLLQSEGLNMRRAMGVRMTCR